MNRETQKRLLRGCARYIDKRLGSIKESLVELQKRQMIPGEKGADGTDGKDGANGVDGNDGISPTPEAVAEALDGKFASWALGFERQANEVLTRAIDKIQPPKDGEDGKDGRDGVGVDGMTTERDGTGRVIHRWMHGEEVVKEFETREFVDAGVWRPETDYLQSNGVTFGGSFWIAQKDTPVQKPGDGDGWRLAVKKGRDGKRVEK